MRAVFSPLPCPCVAWWVESLPTPKFCFQLEGMRKTRNHPQSGIATAESNAWALSLLRKPRLWALTPSHLLRRMYQGRWKSIRPIVHPRNIVYQATFTWNFWDCTYLGWGGRQWLASQILPHFIINPNQLDPISVALFRNTILSSSAWSWQCSLNLLWGISCQLSLTLLLV